MPRAILAHTGAGAGLNSLIALLSADPVSALQKLNPFARPAAPLSTPADDHTGLSASENEGEAASAGKADSRRRRLAMAYEWEIDSASESNMVENDFEKVDWRVEGTGWIEGGNEGMDKEAVLEGKEQEQESERAEIDDEWVGVCIVGAKKEKKARGKKEDRMKAVAKQEVAPALVERRPELAKELRSKAMENLQAEKEDKVDATDCFQPQGYSSKRQPPKLSPHRKLPPKFPIGRWDEVKDEKAGSDVQQQYQQQAQQPETNSEPQPPISPHREPKGNGKLKIPQRQTTSKQRPQYTRDIRRVVDPSISTQEHATSPATHIRNPTVSGTSTHTDAADARVSATPAASAAPTAEAAISPRPPSTTTTPLRIPNHRPTTNGSTNNAEPSSAATPSPPPLTPGNLIAAGEASLACPRPFFDPQEGPSTQRRHQTPLTPPMQPQAPPLRCPRARRDRAARHLAPGATGRDAARTRAHRRGDGELGG